MLIILFQSFRPLGPVSKWEAKDVANVTAGHIVTNAAATKQRKACTRVKPCHGHRYLENFIVATSLSTASGAEKLFLVFVGLWSFVFAQPTALQPRDPSFVSKKEDRRC